MLNLRVQDREYEPTNRMKELDEHRAEALRGLDDAVFGMMDACRALNRMSVVPGSETIDMVLVNLRQMLNDMKGEFDSLFTDWAYEQTADHHYWELVEDDEEDQ